MHITVSTETNLVLIKFSVRGALSFVSHAEMLKVFQRACARAGLKVQHSQGFNPHPKLSLPLPRPVGVESDDELLCVWLNGNWLNGNFNYQSPITNYQSLIMARLSEQLPQGCKLLSVSLSKTKRAIQPRSATYIVPVQPKWINDKLRARIDSVLASENLIIERRITSTEMSSRAQSRESKIKTLDVRPFLESIELDGNNIIIKCEITSAGSIRVDEILELLEIDIEKLTAPVKRTNVQWQKTEDRIQTTEDRIILNSDS
jgi:radical SAM-linked protein